MQSKPIVHYRPFPKAKIYIGVPALIFPIDHKNHAPGQNVSNTCKAVTSMVIDHDPKTGRFETMNTIYELENHNETQTS